ncbi:hypothetical protein LEMLEM_LOCUS20430, partial [Lemmus lemmus]
MLAIPEDQEMARQIKILLCSHEGQSLDSQNSCGCQTNVTASLITALGRERQWVSSVCWLSGLAESGL